jgi:hypothetical protein
MNPLDLALALTYAVIGVICLRAAVRGLRTGKPPFQKGLAGTDKENDPMVMRFQVGLVLVLGVSALAAAIAVVVVRMLR